MFVGQGCTPLYFHGWVDYVIVQWWTHSTFKGEQTMSIVEGWSRLNELYRSSTLVAQICTRFLQIIPFLACLVDKILTFLLKLGGGTPKNFTACELCL